MIDSHCHLNFPQLASDLEGVLQRAAEAKVTHLINIGTGVDDSRRGVELAHRIDNVAATVGIHPCYDESARDATAELRDLAALPKVVAIGECGLDYFHDDVPRDVQRASFVRQLTLAAEVDLPVVVHSRESIPDCVEIVRDFPGIKAVFHCFTAGPAEAKLLAEAGHYVGFTGPLTFKKSDAVREAAALLPADRVLVETDAPYLSPEPLRGKRPCEPGYVAHTLACLAKVRGWSVEEADRITTENCQRLFGWPA
ncbi:MAG: TatD family hydrolase [Planctomycetota bacterium]